MTRSVSCLLCHLVSKHICKIILGADGKLGRRRNPAPPSPPAVVYPPTPVSPHPTVRPRSPRMAYDLHGSALKTVFLLVCSSFLVTQFVVMVSKKREKNVIVGLWRYVAQFDMSE